MAPRLVRERNRFGKWQSHFGKAFHAGMAREPRLEARVVYETRWVEAGTGATPHTVIFSLAPGKRQIQPCSHCHSYHQGQTHFGTAITRADSLWHGYHQGRTHFGTTITRGRLTLASLSPGADSLWHGYHLAGHDVLHGRGAVAVILAGDEVFDLGGSQQ